MLSRSLALMTLRALDWRKTSSISHPYHPHPPSPTPPEKKKVTSFLLSSLFALGRNRSYGAGHGVVYQY